MKIMMSAGEVSGDLHGERLARAIREQAPDTELIGFGGARMERAGVKLFRNFADYNVMGVWEVIKNLRRILKLLDDLTAYMEKERPDLLVLIDYPDFNWRLAKRAKKLGIPVFSYIPPSAWAWRKGRAKKCAALADTFVAIFPHELPVASSGSVSVSSAFTSESPSGSTQETRTSAPARPLLTSTTRSAIVSPAFRLSVCGSSRALIFAPQSCTRGSATRLPSTRSAPVSRRIASSSPSSASSFTVIGKTSVVVNGSSPAAAAAFTSPQICRWLRVKPSGRSPESVTSAGRISSTGTVFSAVPALAISTA